MESAVKNGAQVIKDGAKERTRQIEENRLQPIFRSTLDGIDFCLPKFVRIIERDKKYMESEVCQDSIGHWSEQKGERIVNIFRDSLSAFGLKLFPDTDYEFYYVDPVDEKHYIALDEYFSYLKIARINELKKIAQDLGARHFKVTYMEKRISFSGKKNKVLIGKCDINFNAEEKEYSNIAIEADMTFPGHLPMNPQLKYLQKDPSIQTLVSMRMDETAPLIREKYMLELSRTSGIKEKDAIQIDMILKELKCSGNATVVSEVELESRRVLEYDIEF